MSDIYMEKLIQSPLFKGFDEEEIETFLKGVKYKFVKLNANDRYELKKNKYIVVLSGFLIISVTNKKGRVDTIQGFSPTYNAFISTNASDTTLRIEKIILMPNFTAKNDTLLFEMDSSKLTLNTITHTELEYRFQNNAIQMFSDTMAQRDLRAWCAISPSARETVMRFLLYMYRMQQTENIVITVTRDEIASLLLIDTSTLMRELRYIRNEGIIDYKGKKITILKPEEVIKYSEIKS